MKRMTITLPDEVAEALEDLSADQDRTQVEVLRHAISTAAFLRKKLKAGYDLQLVKDDSVIEVVFR